MPKSISHSAQEEDLNLNSRINHLKSGIRAVQIAHKIRSAELFHHTDEADRLRKELKAMGPC